MGITFSVAKKRFADTTIESGSGLGTDTTLAAAVKAWLDALVITTVYALQVEYLQGFWVVLVVYA